MEVVEIGVLMEYVRIGDRKFGGLSGAFLDPAPYLERLAGMREEFPPGAWRFAADPTHYDFYSPRCVKDLRPGKIEITRQDAGELARVDFLPNPFKHDAPLVISYFDVYSFEVALSCGDHWDGVDGEGEIKYEGLGDVQLDEILPDKQGCSHEIALIGGRIRIVCRDLTATWLDE